MLLSSQDKNITGCRHRATQKKMLQQSINDLFSRKSSKSSQAKRKKLKESTSDESEWEDTQTNMVDILSDQVNDKLAPMIEQIVSVAVAKCLDTVMQEHRDALTKTSEIIQDLKDGIEHRDKEITEIQEANETITSHLAIIEGRLTRCEKLVSDLKEENVALKARSMRDNVIFHNIAEQSGRGAENCHNLVRGFLNEVMKIPAHTMENKIFFNRAHRLGTRRNGTHRPIIVQCATAETKDIIFQHARNLKGTEFSVSEQLPPEINERRGHLMKKFKDARSSSLNPKWSMDKLIVGSNVYSKPDDAQICGNSIPITVATEAIKHSKMHQELGSSFQAHETTIDDAAMVIPVFHQLFRNHSIAKATHNIYAYRIQKQDGFFENSCDDGEYGAGRKLLRFLQENNIVNKIVIVTRWYGGKHMGQRRYECIMKVANEILHKDQ